MTIPEKFAPSSADRAAIEARIAELKRAETFIDVDFSMTAVTRVLLAMPSAQLSEVGAKARAEAYIVALGDLPSFATIEACRRWLRAEAGFINDGKEPRKPNYAFAPSAPELRLVAMPIAKLVTYQAGTLQNVLRAIPRPEPVQIPEAECAKMRERLSSIGVCLDEPPAYREHDIA